MLYCGSFSFGPKTRNGTASQTHPRKRAPGKHLCFLATPSLPKTLQENQLKWTLIRGQTRH